MLEMLEGDSALPLATMALRLLLAAVLGGLIGYERERHDHDAGFRTHTLVTVAACIYALIAIEMVQMNVFTGANMRADPLRVIEAITSGVAFLAAGIIFFHEDKVHGVTTGAGLWLAAAVGLACGLGLWRVAVLGTIFWAIAMVLLRVVEKRRFEKRGESSSSARHRRRGED